MKQTDKSSIGGSKRKKRAAGGAGATVTARERLINAALRQLSEGNLYAVTARTVCDEARVTAPTLYHYFSDLSELYSEVLERIFETRITTHPSEQQNPAEVIDYIWDTMLRVAELESGIIDLFNQLLATGRIPELMKRSYQRLEAAFEVLSHKRPLRLDPKLAAEIFWAAALGMSTLVAATQHGIPYPTGAPNLLRQVILEGIFEAKPSPASKAAAPAKRRTQKRG